MIKKRTKLGKKPTKAIVRGITKGDEAINRFTNKDIDPIVERIST